MRHDTCALVAVSLNLSQRTHPVVWSLNNLPFDCSQVLAVPKPIGKLQSCDISEYLVFFVFGNSISYLGEVDYKKGSYSPPVQPM